MGTTILAEAVNTDVSRMTDEMRPHWPLLRKNCLDYCTYRAAGTEIGMLNRYAESVGSLDLWAEAAARLMHTA